MEGQWMVGHYAPEGEVEKEQQQGEWKYGSADEKL